jgi:hypothetical protein
MDEAAETLWLFACRLIENDDPVMSIPVEPSRLLREAPRPETEEAHLMDLSLDAGP